MAKMVGLSRNLKLPWLNKAVELVLEGLTEQEIKEQLNEYLGFEIQSPTNIRKTREILMNIWFYSNEQTKAVRESALELMKAYPEYDVVLHWCMMLATYPVFRDLCRLIGKLSEFQDEITIAQIRQKLYDEWGERVTLFHSLDKLMATIKALDAMVSEKPGKYHVRKRKVGNEKIIAFMVNMMMRIDDRGYYTFLDLNSSAYLFPFEYKVEKDLMFEDGRFSMNNFGGELTFSLNE